MHYFFLLKFARINVWRSLWPSTLCNRIITHLNIILRMDRSHRKLDVPHPEVGFIVAWAAETLVVVLAVDALVVVLAAGALAVTVHHQLQAASEANYAPPHTPRLSQERQL